MRSSRPVRLEPFSRSTREEAITTFAGSPSETYCEGAFVVAGAAILLFADIGDSLAETHLPAADQLCWRPARDDYHPGEERPWLPAAAIPQFDHARREWSSRTYVFVRRARDDGRWLYCGAAHLGSYGDVGGEGARAGVEARYFLELGRVPRREWAALGGFPGWRVRIEGGAHDLEPAETERLEALLARGAVSHVEITRWEGDSFSVHLNAERGFPMYLRAPSDSGLYVLMGERVSAEAMEDFTCGCCGIAMQFPRAATLTRATASALLSDFFASGEAPEIAREIASPEGAARWVDRIP